jgi:hypothetical protein
MLFSFSFGRPGGLYVLHGSQLQSLTRKALHFAQLQTNFLYATRTVCAGELLYDKHIMQQGYGISGVQAVSLGMQWIDIHFEQALAALHKVQPGLLPAGYAVLIAPKDQTQCVAKKAGIPIQPFGLIHPKPNLFFLFQ